ncbi:hypothetical protein HK098_005148 [Nowakowskiella sp. JEL0407]|nr:hypothetical protein HK098_005148 [Nowakowskiella sp. JEL0407]
MPEKLAEKLSAERRGISTKTTQPEPSQPQPKPESDENDSPEYDISDLIIILRWQIVKIRADRDIDMFLCRIKSVVHSERVPMLVDYRQTILNTPHSNNQQINDEPRKARKLNFSNSVASSIPKKSPNLYEFITAYEYLICYFKIETSIGIDDGRAFIYEVDNIFLKKFNQLVLGMTFPPYDVVKEVDSTSVFASSHQNSASQQINQLNQRIMQLSSFTGVFSKSAKSGNVGGVGIPRVKAANWIEDIVVHPLIDQWQETQNLAIQQRVDIDFELRIEHDFLLLDDPVQINNTLREKAKRLWEYTNSFSTFPAQRKAAYERPASENIPADVFLSISVEELKRLEEGVNRGLFGVDEEELVKTDVLDAKKAQFESTLRVDEEMRKLENDLVSEKAKKRNETKSTPSIASLFAEHEIVPFLQLRHLRLRELRSILLHQLNLFRSIERRINLDYIATLKRHKPTGFDPAQSRQEKHAMALGNILAHLTKNPANQFKLTEELLKNKKTETNFELSEDLRFVVQGHTLIRDQRGTLIIYDVAIKDLETLEQELLRIATIFINNELADFQNTASYAEEMRSKIQERRNTIKNISFLNPSVDRTQILLDLYTSEVQFQYSKIRLINTYMELYEHSSTLDIIQKNVQLLTNLIHLRPCLNLTDKYFTKAYGLHVEALEKESDVLTNIINLSIRDHRGWLNRHNSKLNPENRSFSRLSNLDLVSDNTFTLIKAGLSPPSKASEITITMHHPGIITGITDINPRFEKITTIILQAKSIIKSLAEALQFDFKDLELPLFESVCGLVTWKRFQVVWDSMCDNSFEIPNARRLIGGLDSTTWTENVLLPDLLLTSKYSPYERNPDNTMLNMSISAVNLLNDQSFNKTAHDLLISLMKLLYLRKNTVYSWTEGEYWKRTYELQLRQMGINKKNYTSRYSPLRFDQPESEDIVVTYVREKDDDNEDEFSEKASPEESQVGKFVGLSIGELQSHQETIIDLATYQGILNCVKSDALGKICRAFQVQQTEQYFFSGAVQLNTMVLTELHSKLILDSNSGEKTSKTKEKNRNRIMDKKSESALDINLSLFLNSIVQKKKRIRKFIAQEYNKQTQMLISRTMEEFTKEEIRNEIKIKMIKVYIENMQEIALEEFEKTEFAKIVRELRETVLNSSIGKSFFSISKIKKFQDYFSNQEKGNETEAEQLNSQEVFFSNFTGLERTCPLWYIPHVLEIIMMGNSEKHIRPAESNLIVKNTQIFKKSHEINELLLDLLRMIKLFAHYLQDNNRYISSVKQLRKIDYASTHLTSLKKDLQSFGLQADFDKVLSYISSRWQIWSWKLKLSIASSMYTLEMNNAHAKNLKKLYSVYYGKTAKEGRLYLNLTSQDDFTLEPEFPPETIFTTLPEKCKKLSDAKIQELDDGLDQTLQFSSLDFGGNHEQVFKNQTDFMFAIIKLLALRCEFVRIMFGNEGMKLQIYVANLTDEKTGRLFKVYENLDIPGNSGGNYAFKITEEDYLSKLRMFEGFVNDLGKSNSSFILHMKEMVKNSKFSKKTDTQHAAELLSEDYLFVCPKADINKAIVTLGLQITRWQQSQKQLDTQFYTKQIAVLINLLQTCEKTISFLLSENSSLLSSISQKTRLFGSQLCAEITSQLNATSTTLAHLQASKKIDEKKLKSKIMREYEDLVGELVREINVSKSRFLEFRVQLVTEVLSLMSEVKREDLGGVVKDQGIPESLKSWLSEAAIKEEEMKDLIEENRELKVSNIKMRSFYALKEQALRASFSQKIRKLTEENKAAEEKLWDSYRESESRERMLRKQLAAATKAQVTAETSLEVLQSQIKESQQKSDNLSQNVSNERIQADLLAKLKRYEKLNIDKLLQELQDKSLLIDQLIQTTRDKQGETSLEDATINIGVRAPSARSHSRPRSALSSARFWNRPKSGNILPAAIGSETFENTTNFSAGKFESNNEEIDIFQIEKSAEKRIELLENTSEKKSTRFKTANATGNRAEGATRNLIQRAQSANAAKKLSLFIRSRPQSPVIQDRTMSYSGTVRSLATSGGLNISVPSGK